MLDIVTTIIAIVWLITGWQAMTNKDPRQLIILKIIFICLALILLTLLGMFYQNILPEGAVPFASPFP